MTGPKILVIEDDESISSLLAQVLELEDYQVTTALNGADGLDLLLKSNLTPDLIILDLMMPIMDGATFRKTQLANAQISSIPVILMTADNQPLNPALKVQGFLRKPLSIDKILNVVKETLTKSIRGTANS
jgi:CheY-like chemotaxis protein